METILPALLLCNWFFLGNKVWLGTRNWEAATCMKSVSSCLCADRNFSPCIHALKCMFKKSLFLARKTSKSRIHIRSCHMLPKAKIVFKNCWWNKPIPGKTQQWKLSLPKPKTVGSLSTMSVLFFTFRRMCKMVLRNSISFLFKDSFEGFRKPFKLLRT